MLRKAAVLLALLTLVTGVLYPLAITAVAQALAPEKANGSLAGDEGSALLGRAESDPGRFWGRLGGYDGAASAGTNLGPTNPAAAAAARARIDALRAADPERSGPIPVDLVTASGSGLDPHVSPAAAEYQVPRVARARGLPEREVRALVARHTLGRSFGILGEPRVNVLLLNRDIERAATR